MSLKSLRVVQIPSVVGNGHAWYGDVTVTQDHSKPSASWTQGTRSLLGGLTLVLVIRSMPSSPRQHDATHHNPFKVDENAEQPEATLLSHLHRGYVPILQPPYIRVFIPIKRTYIFGVSALSRILPLVSLTSVCERGTENDSDAQVQFSFTRTCAKCRAHSIEAHSAHMHHTPCLIIRYHTHRNHNLI